MKAISRAGIQIWFYGDKQPFTFGSLADNVVGFVRAEMNAEYRRSISKWTREAMIRKAKAGFVTGGRVFGYDNIRVDGHVERRINPAEAAVVKQIFELAGDGKGSKAIAKILNEARVPCPRAQQGRPHAWAPSSIGPVLRRELYRGIVVYGKTKQRADSGERRQIRQSEDLWLTVEVPGVRIISDDLWDRAKRRIAAAHARYLRGTKGQLFGRPPCNLESRYC